MPINLNLVFPVKATTESARSNIDLQTRRIPPVSSPAPNDFMRITSRAIAYNDESRHPNCDCLERLRLLVSQELDKLNGSFRKKENELLGPIVSRYATLEQRIEHILTSLNRIESKQ